MRFKKMIGSAFAATLSLAAINGAYAADNFPERNITIVVPFPAGGGADLVGRTMAKGMSERLGVSVIVENRGGGGTLIGSQHVARSDPDGYTLLLAGTPHAINASLYPEIPYDTKNDFRTVSYLTEMPLAVAVPVDSDIQTLPDLIEKIKASNLSHGSSGIGGSPHLGTALFLQAIDGEATHVPYRGSNPAVMDLVAGRLDFSFDTFYMIMTQVDTGKLRPLAQTSKERHPRIPELQTVSEQGFPDFEVTSWFSIAAPAATPDDVIEKLNVAMNDTLKDPEVVEIMGKQGMLITGGSADDAQARLLREIDTWAHAVEISGAKIE